jgi:hypothetical protein
VTARLAVWSGPRNISTALMRSWENRRDTVVVDEPLYAYYLNETGLNHPGRDEIIAAGDPDWRRVVDRLLGPVDAAVFYQKHMTHHLLDGLPRDWIGRLTNVLLIREPAEVVASYTRSRTDVVPNDIGLPQQRELYAQLAADGAQPMVVDAADFLQAPRAYLDAMCALIDVPFVEAMLSWPAGPRASDGVWAPYWYDAVRRSTGFEPYRPRQVSLAGNPAVVAELCRPAYEYLYERRLVLG